MGNDDPDTNEPTATTAAETPAPADEPEKSSSTLSNVIIGVTTLLAIVSLFSVWARVQLLDTDEWVDLSVRLIEQPEVQDAVASELVGARYADGTVAEGLDRRRGRGHDRRPDAADLVEPGRAFNSWTTGLVLIALVIGAIVALRRQLQRELADPPSTAASTAEETATADA